MKLIAFTGGFGTGKSTAVQYLKDTHLGDKIELLKFAAPLYDAQEFIYRRTSSVYKRPEGFIKDRKLLQWLGSEFGRSIDENLWINLWKEEFKNIKKNYPNTIVVCDDVRFNNECALIKELGGVIVKITSESVGKRIDTKDGLEGHISENGIDKNCFDFLIKNDYSIEEFYNALDELFKQIL